jgi:endogenous inhibitor of DNA gyrase (YacG/DUF329 family)
MVIIKRRDDSYKENYSPKVMKCMNCGQAISQEDQKGVYGNRFCSERCRIKYFEHD